MSGCSITTQRIRIEHGHEAHKTRKVYEEDKINSAMASKGRYYPPPLIEHWQKASRQQHIDLAQCPKFTYRRSSTKTGTSKQSVIYSIVCNINSNRCRLNQGSEYIHHRGYALPVQSLGSQKDAALASTSFPILSI